MRDIILAAIISPGDIGYTGVKSGSNVIPNVLSAVYFWGAALAVIVIIVAGFLYTTANGNAQQVTRARNAIIAACVGLAVILSAFAITTWVLQGVK